MKLCSKCKVEKSIDLFYLSRKAKDGHTPYCKESSKIYKRENNNIAKLYYLRNRDHLLNKSKIYNKAHKKEDIKKIKHVDNSKILKKRYNDKRSKAMRNGDMTPAKISELRSNATICYWCECSLKNNIVHVDHYIPLSKGGKHTISNMVISCKKCNEKKGAKDPNDFAASIGKLL